MLADLHVHTKFSFDSDEQPENYLSFAPEILGFSEHNDYDARLDGEDIALADVDRYFDYLDKLQERYSGTLILRGIEFGYRAEAIKEYERLNSLYPFDYVINSVHTLPGRGDCYHDRFFEGKTLRESYLDYFTAVLESVRCDMDYQIVGHLGYVSRYRKGEGAHISYDDYRDILDAILKEIIRRDKCLEINTKTGTSGNAFMPDTDIIERYLHLGGKLLSYGSDAHRASDFLRGSSQLKEYLLSIGVSELCYYRERKPIAYKIAEK